MILRALDYALKQENSREHIYAHFKLKFFPDRNVLGMEFFQKLPSGILIW